MQFRSLGVRFTLFFVLADVVPFPPLPRAMPPRDSDGSWNGGLAATVCGNSIECICSLKSLLVRLPDSILVVATESISQNFRSHFGSSVTSSLWRDLRRGTRSHAAFLVEQRRISYVFGLEAC